jgi:Glycosyl hydrolases family 16
MSRFLQLLLALMMTLAPPRAQTHWKLICSDGFEGAAGSAAGSGKWTYDLDASRSENRELENYTDSRDNSFLFALWGGEVQKAFHRFTVECSAARIKFFVDGVWYETVTPASLPPDANWIFRRPLFLSVECWGRRRPAAGNPDGTTAFPQEVLVDYVRVWKAEASE